MKQRSIVQTIRNVILGGVLSGLLLVPVMAYQEPAQLIPMGCTIGLSMHVDGVMVVDFDETCTSAAREAGIKKGDIIKEINQNEIDRVDDLADQMKNNGSESAKVTVLRNGKRVELMVLPQQTADGSKLGIYVKDSIAGIGTVTFYDPATDSFGALGHGVNEATSSTLLPMESGEIYRSSVVSIRKGQVGTPGQLKGAFEESSTIGTVHSNTAEGIFGTAPRAWRGALMPVASWEHVQVGPAVIRSNISGNAIEEYQIMIEKIYPSDKAEGRNFLIRVTDPRLLEKTGGIVQGMSGSPILQDGRLIGAVTHVLVNDPTSGYGIFIGNMLSACRQTMEAA